ncbi:MAG: hypothetical protein ACOCZR_00755 [Halanaerobiales bacterium]
MKKWIYLAAIIIIVLVGIFLGIKFAGVGGGILALLFGNEIKKRKEKIEKAQEEAEQAEQSYEKAKEENDKKIAEAGEDVNAKEYDDADSARDGINDFLDSDSE